MGLEVGKLAFIGGAEQGVMREQRSQRGREAEEIARRVHGTSCKPAHCKALIEMGLWLLTRCIKLK